MSGSILLNPNEYVHILNEDTGSVRMERGPTRVVFRGNEKLVGDKKQAVVVTHNQYCVILNPWDEKAEKCLMGDRRVFVGPCTLFLQYNEILEGGKVCDAHVLTSAQALLLQAQIDHDGKAAGFMWQVKGPCKYIPGKYETILKKIDAISIVENKGIYVKDTETSQLKLVRGPKSYLLGVSEELYCKPYSEPEKLALGIPTSSKPSYEATVILLEKGEAMCVVDIENNSEHVKIGPLTYILGPQETVKILNLSAGKPKKPGMIKASQVKLGPSFMSDIFTVRTKDNADLKLHLTYKWEFIVDQQSAHKVFILNDFIGYSCQSLCSGVSEEAARHNFEEFHNETVAIIHNAIFKTYNIKDSNGNTRQVKGVFFEEMNFLVSEIDVKEISPVNPEISNLLNQSIKSNMVIVCKKMEQEANLNAEKDRVQSQAEIQKLKETLIDIENENLKLDTIEKARISGQAHIEKARAEKESNEIKESSKLDLEVEKMKQIAHLLGGETGARYLELLRAENFSEVKQNWYITTDARVDLPLQRQ